MNIKNIRGIVNSGLPDDVIERIVIQELAADKSSIKDVLSILDQERKLKDELILDMNLNLSRADVFIENPMIVAGKTSTERKQFVRGKIAELYDTYKGLIHHCFKN